MDGEDWEGWSRWCGVYTREEWEIIGHVRDAARYYETGEGSVSRFISLDDLVLTEFKGIWANSRGIPIDHTTDA